MSPLLKCSVFKLQSLKVINDSSIPLNDVSSLILIIKEDSKREVRENCRRIWELWKDER
ncbi:hypothetical protein Q7M_1199 (plasmid) [Borrelia crocidurae str. Achema]|uniref:Uncharacterized protein n=1 Tax=Borrelia crocidurae (strain Achema) TaxID=1155096 RepID=I0FFE1_BORCA|nr:hypothetical protein Q7M_1199 [Borrelia crocidurae str. Achema]